MDCARRRFAVYGLVDFPSELVVRALQWSLFGWTRNTKVFRFPVHVTLRGPFWGECDRVVDCYGRAVGEIGCADFGAEVGGPILKGPDMVWLTLNSHNEAEDQLIKLHFLFNRWLGEAVARDCVPIRFQGSGFEPHITLAWGVSSRGIPRRVTRSLLKIRPYLRVVGVSLVVYPHLWPNKGRVGLVTQHNLRAPIVRHI